MESVWSFRYLQTWRDIEATFFREQWQNWLASSQPTNIFNHPALIDVWIDVYRKLHDIRPLFCIAENRNGTIFMPLVVWKRNIKNLFQKIVVPVGFSDYDYHDPLVTQKVSHKELAAFHTELFGNIRKMGIDAIHLNGLSRITSQDLPICRKEETCGFVTIKDFETIDDYLSTIPKKKVDELKRRKKRLL